MYDLIINVPPLQEHAILFGPPWDAFLPPATGSFLGVALAFCSNWLASKWHQRGLKRYYLKLLKEEIVQSEQKLREAVDRFKEIRNEVETLLQGEGFYPDLLPIDCWNSIISSGDLKLFDIERGASKLIKVYSGIQDYNYKLKRTIDAENESFLYHRATTPQTIPLAISANQKFRNEIAELVRDGDPLLIDVSQLKEELIDNKC
jgi:hypothetical protein